MPQSVYRFETEFGPGGKLDLSTSIPEGTRVEVLVLAPIKDEFEDLLSAAVSSTEFWNNPYDDEDWNNLHAVSADRVKRFGRVNDPTLDRIRRILWDLCSP